MSLKLQASPMNKSFTSPNNLVIPGKNGRYCSPFIINNLKTPNISPIVGKSAGSPFLKKRTLKERKESIDNVKRRRTWSFYPTENVQKQIMDMTLSVKTVLKDLDLSGYLDIFEKEEINLAAFFTLSDEDLDTIGVKDMSDRVKILGFINDFKTPEKPRKLEPKNFLHRY